MVGLQVAATCDLGGCICSCNRYFAQRKRVSTLTCSVLMWSCTGGISSWLHGAVHRDVVLFTPRARKLGLGDRRTAVASALWLVRHGSWSRQRWVRDRRALDLEPAHAAPRRALSTCPGARCQLSLAHALPPSDRRLSTTRLPRTPRRGDSTNPPAPNALNTSRLAPPRDPDRAQHRPEAAEAPCELAPHPPAPRVPTALACCSASRPLQATCAQKVFLGEPASANVPQSTVATTAH